jgi:hypothetical protein
MSDMCVAVAEATFAKTCKRILPQSTRLSFHSSFQRLPPRSVQPNRIHPLDSGFDHNIESNLAIAIASYFSDSSSGSRTSSSIRIRIRNIRNRHKVILLRNIAR